MENQLEYRTKYPIGDLEVNGSVTIECLRNRIAVICSTYGKKTGKRFKTSKDGEAIKVTRIS